MTNPENAVGTNAAFGGRTSPNAFNDVLSGFLVPPTSARLRTGGTLSGWRISGANAAQISIGGGEARDVAVAVDPNGNAVTVNNISGQPITVDMPAKPTTGTRRDTIVAYVNNPPDGSATAPDNPAACGIIVVAGAGGNTLPTTAAIQAAITADGGEGATAYFVRLVTVSRSSTETDINTDASTVRLYNLSLNYLRTNSWIQPQNIDTETFTPYWDTIVVEGQGNISASTMQVTSTMGNSYTVEIINNGDGIQLTGLPTVSGTKAWDTSTIEMFSNVSYSSAIDGPLRLRRAAPNISVYVRRAFNMSNGIVKSQGESAMSPVPVEGGFYVCNIADEAGNVLNRFNHTIASRFHTSAVWVLEINDTCRGAASTFQGFAEAQIADYTHAPAVYRQGTANKISHYRHVIKILRTN